MITTVAGQAATHKVPVIVVVMGGGPLDLSKAKAHAGVGAIMWVGYPGQSGGASIADTVFGKNNPAGKLTLTWYPQEFASQVKISDYGMRPNKTSGNPGRTYRFYTGTPVFKFGEGLSYTTFEHGLAAPSILRASSYFGSDLSLHALSKQTATTVSVTARNTGDRPGDSVVQVFAAPPGAGTGGRALRSLVAFDRVSLRVGETRTLALPIEAQHFTLARGLGQREVGKGQWRLWVGVDGESNATVVTVV